MPLVACATGWEHNSNGSIGGSRHILAEVGKAEGEMCFVSELVAAMQTTNAEVDKINV
jgi:hypothetical protein